MVYKNSRRIIFWSQDTLAISVAAQTQILVVRSSFVGGTSSHCLVFVLQGAITMRFVLALLLLSIQASSCFLPCTRISLCRGQRCKLFATPSKVVDQDGSRRMYRIKLIQPTFQNYITIKTLMLFHINYGDMEVWRAVNILLKLLGV